MCVFSPYDSSCQRKCQTEYSTKTPCDADAQCMWEATSASCKQTCAYYSDTGACTAQGMCRWDAKSNVCRKQCAFDATKAACAADPSCDWLATRAPAAQCAVQCVGRYQDKTACNGDAECMWDSTNARCTDSCARMDIAQCSTAGMCRVDSGACVQTCSTQYGAASSCNADPNCHWDATLQMCAQLCTVIGTNKAECQQSSLCLWTGYTCTSTCAWANATTGTCPAGRCAVNPLTQACGATTCRRPCARAQSTHSTTETAAA
jgi:hypothetical protein